MAWPINDPVVRHAVTGILEHSERQVDLGKLLTTFVDPGVTPRLRSNNNQIVYGRRGTGKTHVLKVLQHEAQLAPHQLSVYVDMRSLGSSPLWENPRTAAFVRVSNLLQDVLLQRS